MPVVLAILLGIGTEEDTSEFNLDLSAVEFPGNQEQTASLESESWIIASQHEERPGGVKGIFVHSCSVVKLLLVVHTHPIKLDWFIAAHRPATVVLRVPSKVTPAVQLEPVVQVIVRKVR